MAYNPTTWANDGEPGINATRLNNLEDGNSKSLRKGENTNAGEATISFDEVSNASSGGLVTIDFSRCQKHKLVLTEDTTVSFTPPNGEGNFQLRILQDAIGGHTITLPTYYTPDGKAYNSVVSPNQEDILTIYYDGSRYIIGALYNIKVVV